MLLVFFLCLAAVTVVLLDSREGREVPQAFIESQQQIAAGTARAIGATASQALSDLRTVAAPGASAGTEPMLDALMRNKKWRGVSVLAAQSRTLVATRGEPVPVQAVPKDVTAPTAASTVAANGELVLVAVSPLPEGQLLAATTTIRLPDADPDPALRQSLLLTTLTGKVLAASGPLAQGRDAGTEALVASAGKAAAGGEPRPVLGTAGDEVQPTLTYARVTPSSSPESLDLAVVAVSDGPLAGTDSAGSGVVPGAVLVVLALLGFFCVRRYMTQPVVAVRADLLRVAAGRLDAEIRASRAAEVARIAAAGEVCQERLNGDDVGRERKIGRISARVVCLVVALSMFAWSAWMLVAFRTSQVEIPAAVVASTRVQTGKATEALRRSVNDGLADLEALAAGTKAAGDAEAVTRTLRASLRELLASQTRYRSLYLVDRGGAATGDVIGRPPLRTSESPARDSGVRQQNQSGRVPVIFAEVPLALDGVTLIGEYDLDHLRVLLSQVPGHARVVDSGFRTISATDGFVAFEQVGEESLRRSAEAAKNGGAVAEVHQGSKEPAIVASAAVLGGSVGRLGWTVTTEKPGSELALPQNQTRRHAQLLALIAALATLFGYGWILFTVLGPLRRVARAADGLVAGDLKSVIYPQRHDEIGTIASCLEICRQAVVQGPDRLGDVRRPSGSATEPTMLMEPVAAPAPRRRSPARAGRRS
ncbi:HAMP domain-containing protein [Lentzea sp. NEAU-D7]|uniref:HAMP domain-containing protein n=1 Tax=Lentzea sp. NEAU-D7 TaxID=2994667 RepID=UPI00224B7341|nr:HAMP domain-containing protein [Lentzea sp. NEAU-D7]MCX2953993.1 HAMP domain-containing protein [Lentzea sp. NEAU-D7]